MGLQEKSRKSPSCKVFPIVYLERVTIRLQLEAMFVCGVCNIPEIKCHVLNVSDWDKNISE